MRLHTSRGSIESSSLPKDWNALTEQGGRLKLVIKDPTVCEQQHVEQRARGIDIASICQPEATYGMSAAAQHKDVDDETITRLNKRLNGNWRTSIVGSLKFPYTCMMPNSSFSSTVRSRTTRT